MPDTTPIGSTNWRNENKIFGIKDNDRLGHIYCIGKTGTGKSTLLLNMAIEDIRQGKGIAIIDPHGDLAEQILDYIPKERMDDVIYFNTADDEYPVAFNPLSDIPEKDKYLVSASIVTTLKKIWPDSWGPRLEHILRNTLLSLSYYPQSTLLDIIPMLTDYNFRRNVIQSVPVVSIQEFWLKEFEPLSPQLKNEFIAPIVNKVGLFATHPILKNILGQVKSSINIPHIMDSKKIFIANLSKGTLGEAGTQLLGSLLVTQFQTASLSRAQTAIQARTPFYLYIDEMHSFMTLSFADILSESRKYGLGLFLTHQFTGQLDDAIRKAIIGNTGTLIVFRMGAEDAHLLEPEFYPVFTKEDLIQLPRYGIYIKLLIDGTTSKPFSANTLLLIGSKQTFKKEIIKLSRANYGKQKVIVETDIQVRYQKISGIKSNASLFEE